MPTHLTPPIHAILCKDTTAACPASPATQVKHTEHFILAVICVHIAMRVETTWEGLFLGETALNMWELSMAMQYQLYQTSNMAFSPPALSMSLVYS